MYNRPPPQSIDKDEGKLIEVDTIGEFNVKLIIRPARGAHSAFL